MTSEITEETQDTMLECVECGTEMSEDDAITTAHNNYVCGDCVATCERCDWVGQSNDDWYYVQDARWCAGCWSDYGFYCERCDEHFDSNRADYHIVDGDTWCQWCTENNATWCDDCDEYRRGDSCDSCEGDLDNLVHNYGYKPNPIFHGRATTELFMGFELEMELNNIDGDDYRVAVSEVKPIEDAGICYLKSDASINGMGFELVTHPHTLEAYEKQDALWDYIERLRHEFGARSWDTNSCGLHVHVSRSAFKSGAHTHRFLSLIYKNPKEMMRLAGRKNSRYAKFNDVYQPDEYGIPRFDLRSKIHNGRSTERYSAVNTNNDYTLELRFFRGNMKREGVMAALELCHASVEYTRDMSVSDVKLGMLKWEWFTDWVESNNGIYPNLYMRMSKLHMVNLDNRPLLNA